MSTCKQTTRPVPHVKPRPWARPTAAGDGVIIDLELAIEAFRRTDGDDVRSLEEIGATVLALVFHLDGSPMPVALRSMSEHDTSRQDGVYERRRHRTHLRSLASRMIDEALGGAA